MRNYPNVRLNKFFRFEDWRDGKAKKVDYWLLSEQVSVYVDGCIFLLGTQ